MLNINLLKNCIIKPPLQMPEGFVKTRAAINASELKYSPDTTKESNLVSQLLPADRSQHLLTFSMCHSKNSFTSLGSLSRIFLEHTFEFIAKGAQGSIYRILKTNYVIKIKNTTDLKQIFSSPLNLNITESDRINHIKAKIGNDIEIMDFIKGEQIKTQFNQREFKQDKITDYLKYIYNAAVKGMRHDIGGKNTLFDKSTGNLTAIDFYPNKAGYKHFIINDAFIQLYSSTKNAKEAESLLSKITLSFLELLKTDTITKKGLQNIDTGLKTIKDITLTNPQYKEAQTFVYDLEKKLKDIIQQKDMLGIFADSQKILFEKIEKLEKELNSKII